MEHVLQLQAPILRIFEYSNAAQLIRGHLSEIQIIGIANQQIHPFATLCFGLMKSLISYAAELQSV